jgi:very-short-patch-repair endonuclease
LPATVTYNNTLNVLTDEARLKGDFKGRRGLHWTEVAGSCKREASGGSKCPEEADVVAEIVREIAENKNNKFSLGVVTPFRAQANLIKSKLEKILKPKHWNDLELIVETADGFQGDERDVIIFSIACQPNMHRGSLWFVSQEENRWNVAVSRARALLHVVGNREFCLNSSIVHVRRLAEHSQNKDSGKPDLFESPWEEKLYDALKSVGIDTVPQHPVAGYRFDLAIPNKMIDIEVDGKKYHLDEYGKRKSSDIWRDMTVENLGWTVLRFWVQELSDDMNACVQKIKKALID